MAKKEATNVPGRKTIVIAAIVIMERLSLLLSRAMVREESAIRRLLR